MVNPIAKHMSSVEDYRARLATLQGAWDTLSLLSHLSGDATDMGGTRQAFEALTAELIASLSVETHRKALLALKAKGQIAIDIIVRNLYERTADIGFLSTDEEIRTFLRQHREHTAGQLHDDDLRRARERLEQRFREYVAKYSVYQDVILLSPQGDVLARLSDSDTSTKTRDALVSDALSTRGAYVETYRHFDLLPGQQRSLVYSFRITDNNRPVGVLCLCFKLEDELHGIFGKLRDASDWNVFALLDAQGKVIGSSDPWQVPVGAPMPLALDESGATIRFAGREYLAVTRRTQGFQGYMGPGWLAHAMVPIEHAFERNGNAGSRQVTSELLAGIRESTTIFSPELRRIPAQAEQIQRELNRAVWNGNIRLALRADASIQFARVLLWEIGNTGRRTQATFEQSISDLQQTVVSSIMDDAQLLASLAADVLDRNLYERANDCRWWALTATLIEHLATGAHERSAVTAVLQHINSLYTVYHDIVLFDAQRRVVATSRPAHHKRVGQTLSESWCAETLASRGSQEFVVSTFGPSSFYDNKPTLVYGSALRASGRVVGGVGIVFDTTAQLESILKDALPRTESGQIVEGCVSVFVDANMRVMAASSNYVHGETVALPRDLLRSDSAACAHIAALNEVNYAVGVCHTGGYREYDATSMWCLVMIPLGTVTATRGNTAHQSGDGSQRQALATVADQRSGEQAIDVATFHCNNQWLGLLREQVVEAIDGTQLRAVPNSPPWHVGLLMFRGNPIPVVDLARLMDNKSTTHGRDVIVIRASEQSPSIGLLVDDLAGIPAIPVSRLLPMNDVSQRASAAIVDHAVRPERPDDPLLLILNLEQLLQHTRAAQTLTDALAPRALSAKK
jgi:chemotaxis signal transduction protein